MVLAQSSRGAGDKDVTLYGVMSPTCSGTLSGAATGTLRLCRSGSACRTARALPVGGDAGGGGVNFASINNTTYGNQVAQALKASGATSCTHWLAAEKAIFKHGDLAPTMWSTLPTFAKRREVRPRRPQGIAPATLRVTKKK